MKEINAKSNPPAATDYRKGTVLTADTVELNDVNSSDFTPYTSGGFLQYLTPVDMAGFKGRLAVKDKAKGGTELIRLTTENGGIVIDNAAKTILLFIDAVATAAITWLKGYYDLEIEDTSGIVTPLLRGKVTVMQEITT
jgi:hypothetical protein